MGRDLAAPYVLPFLFLFETLWCQCQVWTWSMWFKSYFILLTHCQVRLRSSASHVDVWPTKANLAHRIDTVAFNDPPMRTGPTISLTDVLVTIGVFWIWPKCPYLAGSIAAFLLPCSLHRCQVSWNLLCLWPAVGFRTCCFFGMDIPSILFLSQ